MVTIAAGADDEISMLVYWSAAGLFVSEHLKITLPLCKKDTFVNGFELVQKAGFKVIRSETFLSMQYLYICRPVEMDHKEHEGVYVTLMEN